MAEAPKMIVEIPGGGQASVPVPANIGVCPVPSSAMAKSYLTPMRYRVNDVDMMEAVSIPLYSYQAYPAAGANVLTFFNAPVGAAVTAEDTNMQLAAQIPAPNKFLIQGIGIDYLPGIAPVRFGAQSAISHWNDVMAILRRGVATLQIGSKEYLGIGPLMALPPRSHIGGAGFAADQTTPAAAYQTLGSIGYSDGDVFKPIPLLLEAGQNFRFTLSFPGGAVAIPSNDANARIGVVFYGTTYRPPQ